jgi:hypothetical protein
MNDFAPLTEIPYCEQARHIKNGSSQSYPGNVYPCAIYEATNAQIIAEKSVAIITRASSRRQELVCHEKDMVCNRTYNDTSPELKFYTAQSEAFTILFDHSVTASRICTKQKNYACSSESSKFQGRLYSRSDNLCSKEFEQGRAFGGYRGQHLKPEAPCYILPNRTDQGKDFFSLDTLLQASGGVTLDDCNTGLDDSSLFSTDANETSCKTYRDSGATMLLSIYWSDFDNYRGMVEPYYYYAPQFLSGSSFKQNIPYYESYRSSRTLLNAHAIRVAVLLEGDYHEFNVVSFLVTLTTALGLLAVATTIVDTLMLYILPERERYQQAKYEQEGLGDEEFGGIPEEEVRGTSIAHENLQEPLL